MVTREVKTFVIIIPSINKTRRSIQQENPMKCCIKGTLEDIGGDTVMPITPLDK